MNQWEGPILLLGASDLLWADTTYKRERDP